MAASALNRRFYSARSGLPRFLVVQAFNNAAHPEDGGTQKSISNEAQGKAGAEPQGPRGLKCGRPESKTASASGTSAGLILIGADLIRSRRHLFEEMEFMTGLKYAKQ